MKLWLDDVREPWEHGRIGWDWAKTADEAIAMLATGKVEEASLDHDLSPAHYPTHDEPNRALDASDTGYAVCIWLEANPSMYPPNGVNVHSMNPAGAQRMISALRSAAMRDGIYRAGMVTRQMANLKSPSSYEHV